jgi:hypothetical protein
MGMIRKTVSVGTFGMVSFRSKKERLRRAERSQRAAEMSLEDERKARVAAEDRIVRAEKRVKQASAEAEHAARQLERTRRTRSRRRHQAEVMTAVLTEATVRTRKAGRRARKAAAKISPAD